jgi:hypothetical protein
MGVMAPQGVSALEGEHEKRQGLALETEIRQEVEDQLSRLADKPFIGRYTDSAY